MGEGSRTIMWEGPVGGVRYRIPSKNLSYDKIDYFCHDNHAEGYSTTLQKLTKLGKM